jgi:hypothetical protein
MKPTAGDGRERLPVVFNLLKIGRKRAINPTYTQHIKRCPLFPMLVQVPFLTQNR